MPNDLIMLLAVFVAAFLSARLAACATNAMASETAVVTAFALGVQLRLAAGLYGVPCTPDSIWGEWKPDRIGFPLLANYLLVQWTHGGTERCSSLECFDFATDWGSGTGNLPVDLRAGDSYLINLRNSILRPFNTPAARNSRPTLLNGGYGTRAGQLAQRLDEDLL